MSRSSKSSARTHLVASADLRAPGIDPFASPSTELEKDQELLERERRRTHDALAPQLGDFNVAVGVDPDELDGRTHGRSGSSGSEVESRERRGRGFSC